MLSSARLGTPNSRGRRSSLEMQVEIVAGAVLRALGRVFMWQGQLLGAV